MPRKIVFIISMAAELSGKSPEECLGGMMVKHTVSIYDMLSSSSDYSSEMWEEKITDHINYLLILKAMLDDVRRAFGCNK